MSGPIRQDQLYWIEAEQWNRHKVNKLRQVADSVDEWDERYSDHVEIPEETALITQLLRSKADKLEAALDLIENETHRDFDDLIKTVQYVEAGDYGPQSVKQAWEEYGEKE